MSNKKSKKVFRVFFDQINRHCMEIEATSQEMAVRKAMSARNAATKNQWPSTIVELKGGASCSQ